MTSQERMMWRAGVTLMALAVILGAFGAHAVKSRVDPIALGWWETAASYHRTHALGVLLLAALYPRISSVGQKKLLLAFKLLLTGFIFFSGSLYLMTLTQARFLGVITPIGGTLWIVAWVLILIALKSPSAEQGTS